MRDPSKVVNDTHGLKAWAGNPGPMPLAHRHHHLEINYVLRGEITYLISGSLVTLPQRRMCALWGAVPHQTVEIGNALPELIWVLIPLARVLTWRLPGMMVHRFLREGLVTERNEQPGDDVMLQRWVADLGALTKTEPRATLLEIEARLWRMASRLRRRPRENAGEQSGKIPTAVARLAHFLAQNYQQPVTMEDAARAAHVHPHYAMTLFRQHAGLTLHNYLTLQRVAHAQRLLAATSRPILDIALESGFCSASRFYEAFTARTGLSPHRFRLRLAQSRR